MLRRTGVSEDYLESLQDFEEAAVFDERTKAALALAKHMTDHPDAEIPDALYDRLRRQYDEGEILELAAMAGLFHYFNRFNNALGIEPTI